MSKLSSQTQAVLDAFCSGHVDYRHRLAAALRATADQLYFRWSGLSHPADVLNNIADELETH